MENKKRILVVLTGVAKIKRTQSFASALMSSITSSASCQGHEWETGFNVKETIYIQKFIADNQRFYVEFVTVKGGEAVIAPQSMKEAQEDEIAKEYLENNSSFLGQFKDLKSIDDVKPEDFSWIILLGSHGAMADFPKSESLMKAISKIYHQNNGCIAAIGHGLSGLINVTNSKGEALVKGRSLTCFSNEEEKEIGADKVVPFLLEDKLREKEASVKIEDAFHENVVVDERLITAQNHYSSKSFISKVVSNLGGGGANNL